MALVIISMFMWVSDINPQNKNSLLLNKHPDTKFDNPCFAAYAVNGPSRLRKPSATVPRRVSHAYRDSACPRSGLCFSSQVRKTALLCTSMNSLFNKRELPAAPVTD